MEAVPQRITAQEAAQVLHQVAHKLPDAARIGPVADAGACYRLGDMVYVLRGKEEGGKNIVWIDAAGRNAGQTDMTGQALAAIETQARALHADAVRFQTRRAGLVRKACRHGYGVVGFVLSKELQ